MKRCWIQLGFVWITLLAGAGQALPADTGSTERPSANAAARAAGPDLVTLNFVNADIDGVVKVVGEITGKNFVLDPRVKGTVNIVSAKPVSRALVYQVFLSAIRLQGFTAVEERGVVMIVPETDAKVHQSPTLGPQDRSRAGGAIIQTQVFKLQHQSAAQIVPVLRPLIATNNAITAYNNNNTLVVTDYASNLQRIAKIIDSIDQPNDTDPIIIKLRHASAIDVAQTISRLLAEPARPADPSRQFTITADARTNSVLARAGDPSRMLRVRQLVAMLDSPTSASGNIHVIYLKNAVAVKLAEVLRAIYTGESAPASAAARPAASPLGQPQAPTQSASSAPGIIQADAATNSIIITAPDAIYNNLRAAVEKLDTRRAQIYVEALIVDITADRAAEFGIQWQALSGLGKSNTQGFGGTNFGSGGQNIIDLSTNPGLIGNGLNIGVLRGTITIPGVGEILNLGLLVRALETDTNANILATPTLLTLDNEEARIVIAENVPFITGQYAVSAAAITPTPFQTIERKDVGLTLRIRPQVSEGGAIRLQIFQEVSNVLSATAAGPITKRREVESTVLVDDGQIIVIGGLIQDTVEDSEEKVPGLGDIPVLGGLFKYNTRSRKKTNLMVFLQPTLIRSAQSADAITRDRYDFILGEQIKAKPAPSLLPDFGSPRLPPRPGTSPAETGTPEAKTGSSAEETGRPAADGDESAFEPPFTHAQ
ncbi:MAG: type II secretion system secretin GspD [Betaproteobacteria bacterium]|nr:type II secretion system secretin GspD [Betaproteobacteria bacterium]